MGKFAWKAKGSASPQHKLGLPPSISVHGIQLSTTVISTVMEKIIWSLFLLFSKQLCFTGLFNQGRKEARWRLPYTCALVRTGCLAWCNVQGTGRPQPAAGSCFAPCVLEELGWALLATHPTKYGPDPAPTEVKRIFSMTLAEMNLSPWSRSWLTVVHFLSCHSQEREILQPLFKMMAEL